MVMVLPIPGRCLSVVKIRYTRVVRRCVLRTKDPILQAVLFQRSSQVPIFASHSITSAVILDKVSKGECCVAERPVI